MTAARPALVLVVDDDADIREAISDVLEAEGYRVSRACHGAEALERLADCPDLILLDLMMPVMDGFSFARALRERGTEPEIPIVVISANGSLSKAASIGARAFLAKPFDIDVLLAHVASIARAA